MVGLVYQALDKWGVNRDNLVLQRGREEAVVNITQAVARKRTASAKLRKTAHEMLHNIPCASQLCIRGEVVLLRLQDPDGQASKLTDNWTKVIWL